MIVALSGLFGAFHESSRGGMTHLLTVTGERTRMAYEFRPWLNMHVHPSRLARLHARRMHVSVQEHHEKHPTDIHSPLTGILSGTYAIC